MSRLVLIAFGLASLTSVAFAIPSPTPGPLLGAVAGPWGLIASVVGYGAYRLVRSRRS